jgi:hypothetical protein
MTTPAETNAPPKRRSRLAVASFALALLFLSVVALGTAIRSDILLTLGLAAGVAAVVCGALADVAFALAPAGLGGRTLADLGLWGPIVALPFGLPLVGLTETLRFNAFRSRMMERGKALVLAMHDYAESRSDRRFPPLPCATGRGRPC